MGPWEGGEGDQGCRAVGRWSPRWVEDSAPAPSCSTGAFFIPYFIFFFTCGIPVFFLEVALGQYTSQGSVTAWRKICPLLQGECSPLPSYQGHQAPPSLHRSSPFLPCHHLLLHLLSSCAKCCGGHRKSYQTLGGPKLIDPGEEGTPQERQYKITSAKLDWKEFLQVRNPGASSSSASWNAVPVYMARPQTCRRGT